MEDVQSTKSVSGITSALVEILPTLNEDQAREKIAAFNISELWEVCLALDTEASFHRRFRRIVVDLICERGGTSDIQRVFDFIPQVDEFSQVDFMHSICVRAGKDDAESAKVFGFLQERDWQADVSRIAKIVRHPPVDVNLLRLAFLMHDVLSFVPQESKDVDQLLIEMVETGQPAQSSNFKKSSHGALEAIETRKSENRWTSGLGHEYAKALEARRRRLSEEKGQPTQESEERTDVQHEIETISNHAADTITLLNQSIAERLKDLLTDFEYQLSTLAGSEYPADDVGYAKSFIEIDKMHQQAGALRLTLAIQSTPVFLIRLLPPANRNGKVLFSIHDWTTGEQIGESVTAIPTLSTASLKAVEKSPSSQLELERQRSIECLRRRLVELCGKSVMDLATAQMNGNELREMLLDRRRKKETLSRFGKHIIDELNYAKKALQLNFLFSVPQGNGESLKVTPHFANGSFKLRKPDRSRTMVYSRTTFPEISVVDPRFRLQNEVPV